jgi:mono/diheme cytochrome c family protein
MNFRKMAGLCILCGLLLGCVGWWQGMLLLEQPAALAGDPVRGETIFRVGINESPPCITCHQTVAGASGFALGPNLAGISTRAATRVAGLTAEAYIIESILRPKDLVVAGYRDLMYNDFADHFSDHDLADLVAYLMTL